MTGLQNKTQLAEFYFNENVAFIKIINVVILNFILVSNLGIVFVYVYFREKVEDRSLHCH